MAANFECIRNAVGYNDWHQILGNARLIDGRPQNEVQVEPDKLVVGGSFLLLPGWHAFCWWRLWNNGHFSCENSLEEVQGATTSSHILPPLKQDTWPCIQLLCAERHAPCHLTWPLTKTNLQRLQRNNRAMITDQTDQLYQARGWGHGKVKRATGKAWGPQPHFASLVWACGAI